PLLDLTGVSPERVRLVAWVIGASFAAVSGMLIAPLLNVDVNLLTILVVRAFGACAIGRFTSVPLTYAGGLIVGVAEQLVQKYTTTHPSLVNLYPSTSFLILLIVMIVTPKRKLVEVGRMVRQNATKPLAVPLPVKRIATVAGAAIVGFG